MDISQILTLNYKGQEWHLVGDDYTGLNWLSDSPKPTLAELQKQWPAVKAEVDKAVQDKIDAKAALLERLGLTADEAALLIS
jgi:hypothetical protein